MTLYQILIKETFNGVDYYSISPSLVATLPDAITLFASVPNVVVVRLVTEYPVVVS